MKKTGYLQGALALVVFGAGTLGATGARAQGGAKAHKKPAVKAEANRVSPDRFGISFIIPEGYVEKTPDNPLIMELIGPQTNSNTVVGSYQSNNVHVTQIKYIETAITIARPAENAKPVPPMRYSAEWAKRLLDLINRMHLNGNNTLNYQNSAKIQVAGHDALAILAETSFDEISDRGLVRVVLVRHRGQLYTFFFRSVDAEFETKVPAFEKFMSSLKFLQPDVETPADAAPTGPINITITK